MTISVIIPAYNEEKYILKTLTSLKKMKRQPDEIIVVDGASTDNTAKIARDNGAKVITVEHRGIGYAREKGLEKATGDIVAYTDSDTIVPVNWLTIIEETLQRPGVVGVSGMFWVPDGWWVYKWFINLIQPVLITLCFFFGLPMAAGQNMAFLRHVGVAAGGFPKDYKIAEDVEMMNRLWKKGKVILRHDLVVISSGRRGNEGFGWATRVLKAFFYYIVFRKANIIGFPDMR